MVEPKSRCKAADCTEAHTKHYCKICKSSDSNHKARNCPQGINLYHGTKVSVISKIISEGLNPSTSGRIGPGIYFANLDTAMHVANSRGQGTGTVVVRCRVNASKCKTGHHPKWEGVTPTSFDEWCLQDSTSYRITGILLVNGVIDGDINMPGGDIVISGVCTFRGNITAGNIDGWGGGNF
ncbi:hypothetical protein FGO68_gene10814 [Halteria grandinella]|uniref:PARP catalytic domain-containing protein n=1 Tax=Halteria grandinella TaxID=5974 RepID=A0A8J8SZK0_HALGN|nr:hypothetical protein FGO68_gene10814 [Halteria grandinella]